MDIEDDRMSISAASEAGSFLLDESDISEIISCDGLEDDDDILLARSPKNNKPKKVKKEPVCSINLITNRSVEATLDALYPESQTEDQNNNEVQNNEEESGNISPVLFDEELDLMTTETEDNEKIEPPKDEELSLYAPVAEDCISLYHSADSTSLRMSPTRSLSSRSMTGIKFDNNTMIQKPTRDKKINLTENPEDTKLKMIVAKIVSMLNKNTKQATTKSAEFFQSAYKNSGICGVNAQLMNALQRLSSMLLFFHEMKYLYRIVRFAIDLKMTPNDRVLVGLIDYLGWNHDNEKINVLISKISENVLPVGCAVFQCADKYTKAATGLLVSKIDQNKFQSSQDKRVVQLFNPTTPMEINDKGYQRNNVQNYPIRFPAQSNAPRRKIVLDISNNNQHYQDGEKGYDINKIAGLQKSLMQIPDTVLSDGEIIYQKLLQLASNGDWILFGKNFAKMVCVMKPEYPNNEMFTNICETMTTEPKNHSNGADVYMIFDIFLTTAIENYPSLDEDILHFEGSLTRVGVDIAMRVSQDVTYEVLRLMSRKGLGYVPFQCKERTEEQEHFIRSRAALILGESCLAARNALMGYVIIHQYFVEHKTTITSQSTGPALNKLLRNLTFWLLNNGTVEQATEVACLLPAKFGTDMEKMLLCRLLRTVLRLKLNNDKDMEAAKKCIHNILEQILIRQMMGMLRRVIITADFNTSLLIAFKYLESKGLYNSPRILQYPHLIMMPAMLHKEEMSLIVYRHMVEFSEFLKETQQNLRLNLPFRVVVSYSSNLGKKSVEEKERYNLGCDRLEFVLTSIISPALKVQEISEIKQNEKMYNVTMSSVKHWMQINGFYHENKDFAKPSIPTPNFLQNKNGIKTNNRGMAKTRGKFFRRNLHVPY